MESAHMVVLERLAAATAKLETGALELVHDRAGYARIPGLGDAPSSTLSFERDAVGTLNVRLATAESSLQPPPSLTSKVRPFTENHDSWRAHVGSESVWRRVGRLEEMLHELSHVHAPEAGVYALWRSTAALDRVDMGEQEMSHAAATAHAVVDAHDDHVEYNTAQTHSATNDNAEDDDPFSWITGGERTDVTLSHGTSDPAATLRIDAASVTKERKHLERAAVAAVASDPALVLRWVEEEDAYAKATAHELFALFQARQRLRASVPIERVEQRLAAMVSDLETLFRHRASDATQECVTPLDRAQAWLRWNPTYTVTNADEQRTVWDGLSTSDNRGQTAKDWQDLVELCRVNRHRLDQLLARWQRVQTTYVTLAQDENKRLAHAMLQLDALEEQQLKSSQR